MPQIKTLKTLAYNLWLGIYLPYKLVRSYMPAIVAHRGASALAPENTLESFELAIFLGADMLEFDVHRTLDNVLVVCHEHDIDGADVACIPYTLLSDLPSGAFVPTLESVLKLASGRIRLDVELKEAGYEAEILGLLQRYFEPSEYVVTSSLDGAILRVKELDPRIRTGLIIGAQPYSFKELFPVWRLLGDQADFLVCKNLMSSQFLLLQSVLLDLPLYIYTVNDQTSMQWLSKFRQVEGIVTNMPMAWSPHATGRISPRPSR